MGSPSYDAFRVRLFQKTGALMIADGSDDDKVSPEGLPKYKIPPPSIADASANLPASNEVEPAEDEEAEEAGEGEEDEEGEEVLVEERDNPDSLDIVELEDKECDRSYDDKVYWAGG